MGKPSGPRAAMDRSKTMSASASRPTTTDRSKSTVSAAAFDVDTAIFINLSQELKEEGNRLFQRRDHEGAMLKYEKALKLLPKSHIDVAYLRNNMAACYMQMGLGEYPRAISECNLALEVSPKYSKALLKRAKCYEALNSLDLAWRDVNFVLAMEPNNSTALEVLGSVRNAMEEKGVSFDEEVIGSGSLEEDGKGASRLRNVVKEKIKKKKKVGREKEKERKEERKDKEEKVVVVEKEKNKEKVVVVEKKKDKEEKVVIVEKEREKEKDKEVKVVVVEKDKEVVLNSVKKDGEVEKAVSRSVKLVLGEDIRWAQLPTNCGVGLLMDVVRDRFPGLKGVLVKYKDQEGDFVTITSTDELRLAELSGHSQGSLRFYVAEVGPSQEPAYEGKKIDKGVGLDMLKVEEVSENGNDNSDEVEVGRKTPCIEEWIFQFARLFKNHVGIDSDSYLDLHELGVKLYSEGLEDAVTSDDAQDLFDIATDKFQEMTALALFNWGNVHLSKARKRVFFSEDGSIDTVLAQVKTAYEWAKAEYAKAGIRYHEALKIKPDFYEGLLALGQQQFEQAKLCWYHAIGSEIDIESGPSEEVLDLYNKAEDCMEKGVQMWEEMEERRLNGLSKIETYKSQLQKMGLDGLLRELPPEEAAEQAANMSSQIYLLWGTMLYERSLVEFRLELPTWEECLDVAIEKFELAGASQTDIAVMIKNHASNDTALDGLGFKIDEIVQAWNEMYDAKRWETGVPSFRLEPLFRRRVPKLHAMLEHLGL